ncbi:hypothetical protein BDV06DRAFT_219160 [Aspergillus oleicola]
MDAQDDISDFDYSDSEYEESDQVETMRENLEELTLEDPKTLEAKVTSAINDPKALSNFLFQIRNSPSADDLIIDILTKIVDGRHIDSYNLMAPEFFKQAQIFHRWNRMVIGPNTGRARVLQKEELERRTKFDRKVWDLFEKAMGVGLRPIVEDILDRMLDPSYGVVADEAYWSRPGTSRRLALEGLLRWAVFYNDAAATTRLLEVGPGMGMDYVRNGLNTAALTRKWDALTPLVDSVLSMAITDAKAPEFFHDENGNNISRWVRMSPETQRLKAIELPLSQAFERHRGEGAWRLLPAYLICMPRVYPLSPECVPNSIVERIANSTLSGVVCREECRNMLTEGLPTAIRGFLLRHIQELDANQSGKWMIIKAGGKQFKAHKDTLSHWSKYFQGLLRVNSNWANQESVDFGDHMEPKVMEAVLDFMKTGKWEAQKTSCPDRLLNQVLIAADYLQIKALKSTIRSAWAKKLAPCEDPLNKPIELGNGKRRCIRVDDSTGRNDNPWKDKEHCLKGRGKRMWEEM